MTTTGNVLRTPIKRTSNKGKFYKAWIADINLLLVVLLWGVNLPIMKFALGRVDKYAFNAMRLTLSVVALGLIVYLLKSPIIDRSEGARPARLQWLNIFLFAMLTAFGYQVLFLVGIDSTSAGNTALILSAIPMWIAVLSYFFLKERLSFGAWVGLTIAVTGVLVVTLSKSQLSSQNNTLGGNLLVSLAALCWAIGSVWSKPMMKNISPIALTFYSIALTLPLHFLIVPNLVVEIGNAFSDPLLLTALVYSGVFSTGVASALWNVGVKQVGPSHAAGFQNLVPLIALAASWVLIGEIPFALQIAGGVLIIAGLVILRTRR